MSGIRYFSGGRNSNKRSAASELMRLEIDKKGKLDPAARYKMLLKKRLAQSREKAMDDKKANGFTLPGSKQQVRTMSKRAETALKQISMKKAAKEAKALRRMVIVTPKNFHNGSINKKGKIHDSAGNLVAEVNLKNGKMATMLGWGLGKYKAGSQETNLNIQEAINKFSPHFINLRKMQAMQAAANAHAADAINVHGAPKSGGNVWGTSGGNVWGTSHDDVWGGTGSVWKSFTSALGSFFGFENH